MSRIGQLLELKAQRADAEALKQRCDLLEERAQILLNRYLELLARIESLEAKRGPGRPKNDDRIAAGGN